MGPTPGDPSVAPAGQPADSLVVVLVRDLLFSSRIAATARRVGVPCRVVQSVAALTAALAERPRLVMLDLTDRTLDADAALAAVETARVSAPVVAWTTHVLWKATRPFHPRCARVLTKEALTRELPELLTLPFPAGAGAPGAGHETA